MEHERNLEFLIKQSFAASELYWKRTSVFLILNSAMLAIFGRGIWGIDNNPEHLWVLAAVSIIGFLFTLAWLRMDRINQYYDARWWADARRLAIREGLTDRYYYSLGFRSARFKFHKRPSPEEILFEKPLERQPRLILSPHESTEKVSVDYEFSDVLRPEGRRSTEYMRIVIWGITIIWVSSSIVMIVLILLQR